MSNEEMSYWKDCEECSAMLAHPAAALKHAQWHRKLDRRLAAKVSNQPIGNAPRVENDV